MPLLERANSLLMRMRRVPGQLSELLGIALHIDQSLTAFKSSFENKITELEARIARLEEAQKLQGQQLHAQHLQAQQPQPTVAVDPNLYGETYALKTQLNALAVMIGQVRAQQSNSTEITDLSQVEFKVFSQFGDDGIIQYFVQKLDIQPQTFIEFGVESYAESNTRFLLINNNWKGLILDGSDEYMQTVRNSEIHWRHDLTAVTAFIDTSNINSLIQKAGFRGELGILSVDIDGNDYWVWEAIDCVQPVLVISEFNGAFGNKRAVSVPYRPDFQRGLAHHSNCYYGASLPALRYLAEKKGYVFAGCNLAGNNSYFVRKSHAHLIDKLIQSAHFVESKFRESRDKDGNLTFTSAANRRQLIADMPLIDVTNKSTLQVKDLPAE